jgi:hypothetical protein
MFASFFRTQPKHEHARLTQQDSDNLDSDTLLPSEQSVPKLLETRALERSSRDIRIAVKTLVLSTVVYFGAGLWLVLGIQNATIVSNADDFCMHHVSRYCKLSRSCAECHG